jgi:hypothetical protein
MTTFVFKRIFPDALQKTNNSESANLLTCNTADNLDILCTLYVHVYFIVYVTQAKILHLF